MLETLNGVCVSFSAISAPDRLGEHHAERDGNWEFEVAVERKQDQKDQQNCQRTNHDKLRFRFEQFTVFAAPIQLVAPRKVNEFANGMSGRH